MINLKAGPTESLSQFPFVATLLRLIDFLCAGVQQEPKGRHQKEYIRIAWVGRRKSRGRDVWSVIN